jgi:hypothetical protein
MSEIEELVEQYKAYVLKCVEKGEWPSTVGYVNQKQCDVVIWEIVQTLRADGWVCGVSYPYDEDSKFVVMWPNHYVESLLING